MTAMVCCVDPSGAAAETWAKECRARIDWASDESRFCYSRVVYLRKNRFCVIHAIAKKRNWKFTIQKSNFYNKNILLHTYNIHTVYCLRILINNTIYSIHFIFLSRRRRCR